jgi:hypothetical protein
VNVTKDRDFHNSLPAPRAKPSDEPKAPGNY